MNKLPEVVTHPELVEAIVGQFAFMKCMSKVEDHNSMALASIDLQDVFNKADDFFVHLTTFEEAIENPNLAYEIACFLAEWKSVVDVVAIQQNVHNRLISNDK